jgi:hypothetical protein
MKIVNALLGILFFGAHAQAFEMYGHWPAHKVYEPAIHGKFKVNTFEFTVSDWKIANFIECAARTYPSHEIFLEGVDDPQSGNSVVTTAYLCEGEISLSTCQTADKKWSCP